MSPHTASASAPAWPPCSSAPARPASATPCRTRPSTCTRSWATPAAGGPRAPTKGSRMQYHCSFCAKSQDQVKKLIAGPGAVYICDECVDLCREIIEEEGGPAKAKTGQKGPPPKTLFEQLSEYVIGQDQAKKILSVAV